jgi:hypothetical protein
MKSSLATIIAIIFLISAAGNASAIEKKQSIAIVQKKWITETQRIQLHTYLADTSRRVKRHWFPPRDGTAVTIRFKINGAGALEYARVFLGNSNCGICDTAALKAVTNAAPFRPLPLGCPSLELIYRFDYAVFSPDDPHFTILTLGDAKSGSYLVPSECEPAKNHSSFVPSQ